MISQEHISAATPVGTTILEDGACFKVWAPRANAVYLNGIFGGVAFDVQCGEALLTKESTGYWTGFWPGAACGDRYRFWVDGEGSSGYKRDPRARELESVGFPDCFAILREADAYPWHDADFRTPDFSDMVIYQLHIGTYAMRKPGIASNFLDIVGKLPYLVELGVNALQPLPVDEQESNPSMGYGGADLYSPDFPYVAAAADLPGYLAMVNALLAAKGKPELRLCDIDSATGQLKALVDLCHVYGIVVMFDVVYNHAGGFNVDRAFDDNCLYYMDRVKNAGNNNDSLYFTDQDRGTGGLAFALWNADVCAYLCDNARAFVQEYHADGFRYDEISILLSTNQGSGWAFCRDLTSQLRQLSPRILQNAEFWPGEFSDIPGSWQPIVLAAAAGGAGFDMVQHNGLRLALRGALGAASAGAQAAVSMSAIANVLYPPGFDHAWRAVTCVENHDVVFAGRDPRVPVLADSAEPFSWYGRSRSRVAMAILLTAPGIPQIFMGQEFLEPNQWNTLTTGADLLSWDGLGNENDSSMRDFLRMTQDLVRLRQALPALRGDAVTAYYVSDSDRVLAFHRWVESVGLDVVVVASLFETTYHGYGLGFPISGIWSEVFNSDVYDNFVNPLVAGNGGSIDAVGGPLHGFSASASILIPGNSVLVFAKCG
jgi:1,4-alpha-glucan branching enzyme